MVHVYPNCGACNYLVLRQITVGLATTVADTVCFANIALDASICCHPQASLPAGSEVVFVNTHTTESTLGPALQVM
jgi:hypothetical protein